MNMSVTSPKVPHYLASGQEVRCRDDDAMHFLVADRSMVTERQAAATVLAVATATQPDQGNTNRIDDTESQDRGVSAVWRSHFWPHPAAGWQQTLEQ